MTETPHLKITHVADEEQKAPVVNEMLDKVDRAMNQHIDLSIGDVTDLELTITASQFQQNGVFIITGSPPSDWTLQLPNDDGVGGAGAERRFIVINNSSQACTVVQTGGGATVQVNALHGADLHTDGTNVVAAVAEPGFLANLQDVDVAGTDLQDGDTLVYNAAQDKWIPGEDINPFDIGSFVEGAPVTDQIYLYYIFARSVRFLAGLPGSQCNSRVDATADVTLDIQKNGVSIGGIQYDSSTGRSQFIFAAEVDFVAGDEITVQAPTAVDATLSGVAFTLKGIRLL